MREDCIKNFMLINSRTRLIPVTEHYACVSSGRSLTLLCIRGNWLLKVASQALCVSWSPAGLVNGRHYGKLDSRRRTESFLLSLPWTEKSLSFYWWLLDSRNIFLPLSFPYQERPQLPEIANLWDDYFLVSFLASSCVANFLHWISSLTNNLGVSVSWLDPDRYSDVSEKGFGSVLNKKGL